MCGRVVHEAIANYISQIQWLIEWSGTPVDHFDLVIDGANDGQPVTFSFDPETGEWLGNSGLHSAGDKVIIGFSAHLVDGGHVDLTQEFIDYLGDDTITVRFPQEDSFGDCASPSP